MVKEENLRIPVTMSKNCISYLRTISECYNAALDNVSPYDKMKLNLKKMSVSRLVLISIGHFIHSIDTYLDKREINDFMELQSEVFNFFHCGT